MQQQSIQFFLYHDWHFQLYRLKSQQRINNQKTMGCTDSTALENHLYARKQQPLLKNPHQLPSRGIDSRQKAISQTPTSQFIHNLKQSHLNRRPPSQMNNSQSLFQNSQQYLQQLYEFCQGNLQKFFAQLQQKISQIYMTISKDTLEQMNQNILVNNESKIQISEEILWFNLNILKVVSRKSKHKFNPSIFKQINKLQKNLVGYLKMKYPRGGQSFVPGDLMTVFKQFDLTENIEFDIVKNADTYFGSDEDQELSRQIKLFLNKIMTELDSNYPKFEKMMQQQVFVVLGQQGEKKALNYKIGRKIPQNVSKYTDLQSNTLQITSPQIFRVLIKWMQYLQQILTSPSENINKKKNFKCFIEQNQRGEKFFDQVNEDEYYDLINYQLVEKIEKEKVVYENQNDALLKDMDRFNSHLIKLLDTSIRRQKFVPVREMETIKYSNLNAKFIAWVLGEKLMLALKKLIKVGRSFYNTKAMINLDLIQFKVSDMMRSMVSGSKKDILAVYSNLKRLQNQGTINIIKIKNRLGTSLNDAMIIFSMKDTFLICEIQLILADSQQKANQKYKNIELLNHFFYQLERSPYGILSEIAVLLAYKDSKVAYEDNITFEINKVDIQLCERMHTKSVVEIKLQSKPFICTKCTKFYFKYENMFLMKHCQQCNIFICGKCIFQTDKQLQKSVIYKQITTEIQRAVAKTMTKLRNISSSTGASSILQLFASPFKKMQQIFGGKVVQITKLIDYLNTKVKNNQQDLYFTIVGFRTGRAVFKQLVYKPAWKQIQNPFSSKQSFNDKKLTFTSYDLLLFYDPTVFKQQRKSQFCFTNESMLHLYVSEQELLRVYSLKYGFVLTTMGIADFKLVVNIEKPAQVQSYSIQQQKQYVQNESKINKCTKQFKHKSLHEATAGLPDLAGAKRILKLKDLGIQDTHMLFFKQIPWANTIKQLKLNKNNISSLQFVLQNCVNLERLYANQNYIRKLVFTKQLTEIDIINVINNEIVVVDKCENIRNISKLLLEGNKLEEFPQCEFPNLKILNLKSNPIKDFCSVYNSTLPNIQQLSLHYQQYQGNPNNRPNLQVDLQLVTLPFEKLKSFQSESNFRHIIIQSRKIQRITLYRNNLRDIELCSLQNLRFVMLKQNNLQSIQFLFPQKDNLENNSITEIDVSVNNLTIVPVMKSTSLTKINLSDNAIQSISNLTLSLLPNLELVDLSNNKITQMVRINLPKVKQFNLYKNPLANITEFENSHMEMLQKLELSNCAEIGAFPLLMNMNSLSEISVSWTDIDAMHNLAKSILPQLKTITLDFCTLKEFPLLEMESLETLSLTNCTIRRLGNLEKSKFDNLKMLVLNYSFVEENAQGNEVFDHDVLGDNNMHKNIANKEQFSCKFNFPKLQSLHLDGSNLKNMTGLQQSSLPMLQQLNIQTCHFQKYPKLRFPSLKALHAGMCQLQTIESILTPELLGLEKIFLSGNLMQRVNMSMKQVKVIDLSVNRLVEFTHTGELSELQELNLSSNKLQMFPSLHAGNLKKILIDSNPLTDISLLSTCHLPSLQQLKITNCNLSKFPFPILKLQSVKSIYMNENQINNIDNLTYAQLPFVEDINFSGNMIQKLPVIKLPKLKFLRVNSNRLQDIDGLSLSQCPELTIIELQTNLITKLPTMPFPNLTKIFMHENQCTNIKQFNQSSTIKSFSILNVCSSIQLEQFPMLKCTFEEIYANNTRLCDVIKVNQYKGLIKLQLNGNGITHLPMLNQRDLQMIQFQDNQIESIDEFAKGQYHQCTQFSVKGNKLTHMPTLKMQKLKRIYLNQNQIQDVKLFCESNLVELEMISLENNKLRKVDKLPFPKLKQVYLSKNQELQELTCFNLEEYSELFMVVVSQTGVKTVQTLPKMQSLQKIWVCNSKLEDLSWFAKSLKNLPKLIFANFSSNQLKSIPSLKQTSTLAQLYITSNPIENIDELIKQTNASRSGFKCYISYKGKNEEDYSKISSRVKSEHNYISIDKYYGS